MALAYSGPSRHHAGPANTTTEGPAVFLSDSTLEVDGVLFKFGIDYAAPTDAAFYLAKPPKIVHDYLALVKGATGNIVELGIFRGGSAALMALVAKPKRITVIDICEPVDELDQFIADRGLHDQLRAHYRVDQSDRPALAQIMADDFGGEALDLVIDDASTRGADEGVVRTALPAPAARRSLPHRGLALGADLLERTARRRGLPRP